MLCLSDLCLFCLILNFSNFLWWRNNIAVCFLFITLLRWCNNVLNTTISRVLVSNIHFCLIAFWMISFRDVYSESLFLLYTILTIHFFNLLLLCFNDNFIFANYGIRSSCLHNLISLISAWTFIYFFLKFSDDLT